MPLPRDLLIRLAVPSDATELADVHIHAWREQYKGILPESYVEHLTLNFPRRVEMWRDIILIPRQSVTLVAEISTGVIGFAYYRPAQDLAFEGYAQLDSIYMLDEYKRRGIGDLLITEGFDQLLGHGFHSVYCWVLDGHSSAAFFERMGAQRDVHGRDAVFEDQQIRQVAYVWPDIANEFELRAAQEAAR